MDGISFRGAKTQYSLRSRAERLIATGRVILVIFFIIAVWLDPTHHLEHAEATSRILLFYLVYALVLSATLWNWDILGNRSKVFTHILDLAIFSYIMSLTEGPTSPFFVYFVFLLISATVRWQWYGTLWTVAAAISLIVFMAWYPENLFKDPSFELNRFTSRIAHLAVAAMLLGYMGAHEHNLRIRLSKLAAWPLIYPTDINKFLRDLLEHSAAILDAPRMLLVWEDKEEPILQSALWSSGDFSCQRESFASTRSMVAGPLIDLAFFCSNTRETLPTVVRRAATGLQRWRGLPITEHIQKRFNIGSVLCVPLQSEHHEGFIMALDKTKLTSDDLSLGNIIAHEASTRLDRFFLLQQLKDSAVADERIRLARDLHDGLLQSLSGAALQMQAVHRLIQDDPQTAMQRLSEIQQLIAAEQKDLRSHIQHLKPSTPEQTVIMEDLTERLEELTSRIKRHRGISISLRKDSLDPGISVNLIKDIYFIVHESVINAARHSSATSVQVELSTNSDQVHILVEDNGRGFPFHGSFGLEDLMSKNIGPVTLKERVSSLGGSLVLDSSATGTRLEIHLPLERKGQ